MIRTLHDTFRLDPSARGSHLEQLVARSWPLHLRPFDPPTKVFASSVPVRINHGRWIVDCPFCPGAQMADPEDRRFFCVDCLHAGTPAEGCWLRVEWPPADRRAAAEELLERRLVPHQNWQPETESIGDLRRENEQHEVA